jgi:hypothetical protein
MVFLSKNKESPPTCPVSRRRNGIFTDEDSSLELVAGAGDAHDRRFAHFPPELLCVPVLEELR